MSDLQPGPELDALISEKVMGYNHVKGGWASAEFKPSTTWEGMGLVVEKLMGEYWFELNNNQGGRFDASFKKKRSFEGEDHCHAFNYDTAPHAVCLASLKAVGTDKPNLLDPEVGG